jgi:hypothetical protein
MTSTVLRYTTATPTAADAMARIHAAALAAPRKAAEATRAAEVQARRVAVGERYAHQTLAELRADGAVTVGFKICHADGHKIRVVHNIDDAMPLLLRTYADPDYGDAEVWGIRADGTYCEGVY